MSIYEMEARYNGLDPGESLTQLNSMLGTEHVLGEFFRELNEKVGDPYTTDQEVLWETCLSHEATLFRRRNQSGLSPNERYVCGLRAWSLKSNLPAVCYTEVDESGEATERTVSPRFFYNEMLRVMSVFEYHSNTLTNSAGLNPNLSPELAERFRQETDYRLTYRAIIDSMARGQEPEVAA